MFENLEYINNELYFDKIKLKNLKTPAYIYSKNKITKNFEEYRESFKNNGIKNFEICFAVKANENLTILKILKDLGAGADTVSMQEIEKSIYAGINPNKIVYSGIGKSDEELEFAIKNEIMQINIESKEEFYNIRKIAKKLNKKVNISVRINPNINAETHEKISTGLKQNKFGVTLDVAEEIILEAKKDELLDFKGLSVHIGSQILNLDKFDLAFQYLKDIYKKHPEFTTIDLGGGVGIQYKEDDKAPSKSDFVKLIAKHFGDLNLKIIIEPGRSIVGDAAILLTKVLYVKNTDVKNFIVVDAGMNTLIRPAMYDAYHHPMCVNNEKILQKCDIVGPICESSDIFVKDVCFPKVEKDDLIAFLSAGAYGRSMSSLYNLHPIASELMIDEGKIKVIRKEISYKDLIKLEE